MLAVIFEVEPAPGKRSKYLDIAKDLLPHLDHIEGFLSIERFQSLTDPDRVLSLSFWQNEEAIARWRRLDIHRNAQKSGRAGTFSDYRLRVAEVVRDYGLHDRNQAPQDSQDVHLAHPQSTDTHKRR